jgi:hypothetical protein
MGRQSRGWNWTVMSMLLVTATPSTVAGWYVQRRAASTAAALNSSWLDGRVTLTRVTAPLVSISTWMPTSPRIPWPRSEAGYGGT